MTTSPLLIVLAERDAPRSARYISKSFGVTCASVRAPCFKLNSTNESSHSRYFTNVFGFRPSPFFEAMYSSTASAMVTDFGGAAYSPVASSASILIARCRATVKLAVFNERRW